MAYRWVTSPERRGNEIINMNIHIRDIPEEIHEKLKSVAKEERRSMNEQVIFILEQSLKADTTSAHDGTEKH